MLSILISFPVFSFTGLSRPGSFSDNFYNSDGKDCNCVPLTLQKNYKLKLE